jgi:hypothetical protein
MNTRARSPWRRTAIVVAALTVAVASSVAGARPVAASETACTTVSLTSAAALSLDIVATDCGSAADATYSVTAELFERRTSSLVASWAHPGGGTPVLVDATRAVPVGGWYDLLVTSLTPAGPEYQEAAALVGDGGRPTIDVPVLGFQPGRMSSASYPAAVRWASVGTGTAAKYQVDRSVNGGPFARFATTRATSLAASLVPGRDYAFRVRGVTAAGVRGPWRSTAELRPRGYGDASSALTYGGTWRTVANDALWGGRAHVTGTAGRSVTMTFTGGAAAVVSTLGPSHGSFRVYVDGVYRRTVKTYATGTAYRRVVYSVQWPVSATHTIRIVVAGTAGHPRVDIDGILVLRPSP